MSNQYNHRSSTEQVFNLKFIFQKIVQYKLLFLASIILCLISAFVYLKLATPQYEVSTSILIDTEGSSRALGDSQYVDGGVSLIEMEKNLYNEIGIIKSFSLIEQTVSDLDFDVSYYGENWYKKKEYYDYFPFKVVLKDSTSQLYGLPFEVTMLPNNKYRLKVEGDNFQVLDAASSKLRSYNRPFNYSKEHSFGEEVTHEYFNFVINRSKSEVNLKDFEGESLSFNVNNSSVLASSYASKIEVSNIDLQASIFKLDSEGPIINKEIDFLQKLTDNYVQNQLASRNDIATSKETFIQNQLAVISDSLSKVESQLEVYKKNKRALNLGATATNALRQTSNLQVAKGKIQMEMNYYQTLIESVSKNRNSPDFEIPTAVGIEDPLINSNIIELKQLYDTRSKKRFFVTSNNEEMSILNGQIKASTDLLLNNLRNAVKSAQYELSRISAQLNNYDGVISSLPTRENELLTIERKSVLYENLFKYLSQELAKAGIARAESTTDTRVLDEARLVGNGPVSPNKKLIISLGLFLGILLPLLWVLLFTSNDVIENVNQIMANSEIPVIASIIHHDDSVKKSKSDVSLWKLKESFRDLSTNLHFVAKEPCVIGITSILPEEGKTYNAINLGITFAEAGKKTLIIDTDLRNPSIVQQATDFNGQGLSNYLKGDTTAITQIVYPHKEVSNLKFIPTNVIEGNVHELLSNKKFSVLLNELKEQFDYIILDTPAAGLVSDFLLLSDFIDINLFVVRRNVAKMKFLDDLRKLTPTSRSQKSFIVFNDVPQKQHKYGYEEKYGRNKEKQLINKSLSI